MFKDYDKYLSASLRVYLIVLISIFIMKIVGLDYFGIDLNNKIILKLNDFVTYNKIIRSAYNMIFIMFYQYIMIAIICNNNSKKMKLINIISTPITLLIQLTKSLMLDSVFTLIIELIYLFILTIIINQLTSKLKLKKLTKRFIVVFIINFLFQLISSLTRYNYSMKYIENQVANILLNLDYIMMTFFIYKLYFMKGVDNQCTFLEEVGLSSQKKMNLKNLRKRLHVNLNKFKKQDKETKLTIIIYSILSLFWNVFSVFVVLLFAKLNNTLIECIFILTSFWLSKRMFGKAFHLQSMLQCFIVSNLTYYVLNRITTPLGISIFVPILLGVGLSYVTSKLVKKIYKPLYRGMSKDLFEETILQVVDKDSDKYKICYDFYINKKSALNLSYKYNYSEAGIRKIKDRVNDKIKRLE